MLYLSVSGVLAAMFSVRITADPKVKRQMQALRQERVALVLRSVDCSFRSGGWRRCSISRRLT